MFKFYSDSVSALIEQFSEYADAGMGYAIVYFADAAYTTESMEMFAAEVMPALT